MRLCLVRSTVPGDCACVVKKKIYCDWECACVVKSTVTGESACVVRATVTGLYEDKCELGISWTHLGLSHIVTTSRDTWI